MGCKYKYKGQTYEAWEFVDVLAAMPIDQLWPHLPEEAREKLRRSGQAPSVSMASVDFNPSDYKDVVENAPTTIKEWLKAQFTQRRPFMLGFLTLDQIADIYGKTMKSVRKFAQVVQAMDTEKQKIADEADHIVERWRQLDPSEADRMADVMHTATLVSFDPDNYDIQRDGLDPVKAELHDRFSSLSDQAKQIYREARDSYQRTLIQVRDALEKRVKRAGDGGSKISSEIRMARTFLWHDSVISF
jgi:DNA-binding ferritin-like protein